MRQSHVYFFVSEFFPVQNAVSIRTQCFVRRLRSDGIAVRLITSGRRRLFDGHIVHGVSALPPTSTSESLFRLFREIWLGFLMGARILLISRERSVVVISTPPFFMASLCVLAARLRRLPYVLDIRDRYPNVFFSLGLISPRSLLGRLFLRLEFEMCAYAKYLVTVTYSLAGDLRADFHCPVEVVRNGFDADIFQPRSVPDLDCFASSVPRVITHGLFGRFFDLDTFLKIVRHCQATCPPHEFLVVGYGPKIDIIVASCLSNVVVLPAMSQRDVAQLVRDSDIGLSVHSSDPSMLGSFPVKVMEYIGAGIPSIVLPYSEAGMEVAERGLGWSYDPSDWKLASDCIASLLCNACKLQEAKHRVLSQRLQYTRDRQADYFVSVVTSALTG
jgi:glycosyltransferase involved in cell wall biosynthesis